MNLAIGGIASSGRKCGDRVSVFVARHFRASCHHVTGDLEPGKIRGSLRRRISTLALQHVGTVHTSRLDPD